MNLDILIFKIKVLTRCGLDGCNNLLVSHFFTGLLNYPERAANENV